jgi:anti-sigma factor (TIGR02949 family)
MGDCKETLDRLYEYLDRELSEAERREVQQHLDDCPPCLDRFKFEENVLRLVRRCCRDVEAPPSLVEKVRQICNQ